MAQSTEPESSQPPGHVQPLLFTAEYIFALRPQTRRGIKSLIPAAGVRQTNNTRVWSIFGDIDPGANLRGLRCSLRQMEYHCSQPPIINSGASWISSRSPLFPLLIREILCINETRPTCGAPGCARAAIGRVSASPMQMTCFCANKTICRPGARKNNTPLCFVGREREKQTLFGVFALIFCIFTALFSILMGFTGARRLFELHTCRRARVIPFSGFCWMV